MQMRTFNRKGIILFSLFFTIYTFYCILQLEYKLSFVEYAWLILRITISSYLLYELFVRNKYSFSLRNIVYIFFLTFFMLAPILQYFSKTVFWSADKTSHNITLYFIADLFILLFLAVFGLTYNLRYKFLDKIKITNRRLKYPNLFYIIITGIHLLIFFFLLRSIGFPEMLFRFTNKLEDLGTSAGLIIGKYVKALSIVIVVYLISDKKDKTKGKKIFILLNILLFSSIYFPTSAARFQIIAAYLGLILIISLKSNSKYNITLLFLIGLFIVFPSLEVFRNLKSFDQFDINNVGTSINSAFNQGHYDSYQMFVNCIYYITENSITWGKQLLGVLFFFVPRSVWPGKPIGSGASVAENLNLSFDNVSMPIIGEAYINFGVLGIILFAIFFGFVCRLFDQIYWTKVNNNDNGLLIHFYPVLIGYFFFMNRGDLMSSFAFIIGIYFAFLTIFWIKNIFSTNLHR